MSNAGVSPKFWKGVLNAITIRKDKSLSNPNGRSHEMTTAYSNAGLKSRKKDDHHHVSSPLALFNKF